MIRNLAQLEAYFWIARLGSFHAAAARLNLTQPTISSRIKELERSLGVALFERGSRPVQVTSQGAAILDQVQRIFALVEEVENKILVGTDVNGHLNLGVPDSFAFVCLPSLHKIIRCSHPNLILNVTIDTSRALTERVLSGELDAAVVAHPNLNGDLKSQFLGVQEISWVTGGATDLKESVLLPNDLQHYPIYSHPPPSDLYKLTMDWFAESNIVPTGVNTCTSVAIIVHLVSNGIGSAILPINIVRSQVALGSVRLIVTNPMLDRQPVYAIRLQSRRSRAVEVVLRLISKVIISSRFLGDATDIRNAVSFD
jgi:DNA-binding transcriptional LysR family regulator